MLVMKPFFERLNFDGNAEAYRMAYDRIPPDWSILGQLRMPVTHEVLEICRHLAAEGLIEERHQVERHDRGTKSWFEFRRAA
jgi:hypothetical protein